MSFVHLHLHSQYSLLDGAITVEGMLHRAKQTSMPAVALTDHGNLYGALEFYQKAKAAEIKPIIGIEGYVTQGSRKDKSHAFHTHHIVLLAKNNVGLRNLFKLVTLSNLEGYYYKPRMDREILRQYSEGIICLSACLNGVPAHYLQEQREDLAMQAIQEYREIFGEENYYVEIMETGVVEQDPVNKGLIDLAQRLSVPVVATNDCHYLNREDTRAHDILLCIGTGKKVDDQDRMKFSTHEFYMKTPDEMKELISYYPESIRNTLEIANKCNVELDLKNYHMPKFALPEGKSAEDYLSDLAKQGLEKRLPQILRYYEKASKKGYTEQAVRQEYNQRLETELEVIRGTGFSGYFLIVQDFINHAKNRGIPVGPGRGSAAGSLAAFALRITDIDPIPYNLLFERFLNKERVSMPDIDVDFCQDGRDEVIKYVASQYGGGDGCCPEETKVAQIATFGKLQAKAAIRDVGRALGMPYGDVDKIAKMVPGVLNITLKEAFEMEPKFSDVRKNDSRVDDLLNVAVSLEGLTRHASVHAAGVVISDDQPLCHHLPLAKGQHGEIVTQWDMKGVEKVGLVKFDFLGLKTLTLLARAVKLIKESRGKEIDLLEIDVNDPKVYEMLGTGDTQGVFQLESSGMRELVSKLKPSNFEDILALVALYRPGPLGSGMVDDFINRKHGRTAIVYELPELEPILKDTYGVILYQEQVMQIASVLAEYTLGEADLLRRAMGKKIPAEMQKQEARFLEGCQRKKIPTEKAKRIFDLMEKFSGYGFNKSHSAAYALISYQTAYLKAHYPVEFMAACLSIDRSNTDRVVLHIHDCRQRGIEVIPPNVNISDLDFTVVDGKIVYGLGGVKNVGDGAVLSLMDARKQDGPFKDMLDFCTRVDLRLNNKKVLEAMIKSGSFDVFGHTRATLLASLDTVSGLAAQAQKDKISNQNNLFGDISLVSPIKVDYVTSVVWDDAQKLTYERESLGFYFSGHPLEKHMQFLNHFSNANTQTLMDQKDDSTVRLGGMMASLKETTTKRGDRMAFMQLEDLLGRVEVIVFSETYKKSSELIKSEEPMFVVGTLDKGEDSAKIIAQHIVPLSEAPTLFDGTLHVALDAAQADDQKIQDLLRLFQNHKGNSPAVFHIQIPGKSETVLSVSKNYRVKASPNLIDSIVNLLGNGKSVWLQ